MSDPIAERDPVEEYERQLQAPPPGVTNLSGNPAQPWHQMRTVEPEDPEAPPGVESLHDMTPEQRNVLGAYIAGAQDPNSEIARQAAVDYLAEITGRDRAFLYDNYESVIQSYTGQDISPASAAQALEQWWKSAWLTYEASRHKGEMFEALERGASWDELDEKIAEIREIEEQVVDLDVLSQNPFLNSFMKPAIQNLPRMLDPMLKGSTANMAARLGVHAAMALSTKGMSLAQPLIHTALMGTAAQMTVGALHTKDMYRNEMIWELYNLEDQHGNRVDPRLATSIAAVVGSVNGAIQSARITALMPGGIDLIQGPAARVMEKLYVNRVLQSFAVQAMMRYGTAVTDQGLGELMQEVTQVIGRELAVDISNQSRGTDFDKEEFQDQFQRVMTAFAQGWASSAVYALPTHTVQTVTEAAARRAAPRGQPAPAQITEGEVQQSPEARQETDPAAPIRQPTEIEAEFAQALEAFDADPDATAQRLFDLAIEMERAEAQEMRAQRERQTEIQPIEAQRLEPWQMTREQFEAHVRQRQDQELAEQRTFAPRDPQVRQQIREGLPTLSDAEVDGVAVILDMRAEAVGMDTRTYVAQTFQDRMFAPLQPDQADPLAQQRKGGVAFDPNDGRALILWTETTDFSTAVHEIGHILQRQLAPESQAVLANYFTDDGHTWTTTAQERFAEAWEAYVLRGEAPSPQIQNIFQQFAEWMRKIYDWVAGNEVQIPQAVSDVFDTFLTDDRHARVDMRSPLDQLTGRSVESSTTTHAAGIPVTEVPVANVRISGEVQQFKADADPLTGVVEPLRAAEYERLGTAPIVVWERTDGSMEVITGRHRLDLARRLGLETIPAQVVREDSGFTAEQARTFDAEANIRDGQGTIDDYLTYFEEAKLTPEQASERGLLSRDKGRTAYSIAHYGTEELITLYRNRRISAAKAATIAEAAPGEADIQRAAMAKARTMTVDELSNFATLLRQRTVQQEAHNIDLFGDDDTAMVESEQMAREASRIAAELGTELATLRQAVRMATDDRRAQIAQRYGFDPGDTAAMAERVDTLRGELEGWREWYSNPQLFREVRQNIGLAVDAVPDSLEMQHPVMDAPARADDPGQDVLFQQAEIARTPEFRAWFGQSRVVDDRGQPLPVYHGTSTEGGIESFDPALRGRSTRARSAQQGFFFTSRPEVAADFSRLAHHRGIGEAESVTPVFLSMQNPLIVDQIEGRLRGGMNEAVQQAIAEGRDGVIVRQVADAPMLIPETMPALMIDGQEVGQGTDWINSDIAGYIEHYRDPANFATTAERDAYRAEIQAELDGMVAAIEDTLRAEWMDADDRAEYQRDLDLWTRVREAFAADPDSVQIEVRNLSDIYVVFEPTQIKSAIANRGTFDPADPGILYQTDRETVLNEIAEVEDLLTDGKPLSGLNQMRAEQGRAIDVELEAESQAHEGRRLGILRALGDRGLSLRHIYRPQEYAIIHRSTRPEFVWQVSYFDDRGPWGDTKYETTEALVRDVRSELAGRYEADRTAGPRIATPAPIAERVQQSRIEQAQQSAETLYQTETIAGLAVRPSPDDAFQAAAATYEAPIVLGNRTMHVTQIDGGVDLAQPTERSRVDALVQQMRGPDGHIARIIVEQDGTVVEGAHRLEALRAMGIDQVPVVVIADALEGIDADTAIRGIKSSQALHTEQARDVLRQALDMVRESGSVMQAMQDWVLPAGYEAAFRAAFEQVGRAYPQAIAPDTLFQTRAYHGSPHSFDKFTLDRIGTGEGAQVYGWGLYFASRENIARFYADELSTRSTMQVTSGQAQLPIDNIDGHVRVRINQAAVNDMTGAELAKSLRQYADELAADLAEVEAEGASQHYLDLQHDMWDAAIADARRVASALEGSTEAVRIAEDTQYGERHLYDVTISPGDTDVWLDYDGPITEEIMARVREAGLPEVIDSLIDIQEPGDIPAESRVAGGRILHYEADGRHSYQFVANDGAAFPFTFEEARRTLGGEGTTGHRLYQALVDRLGTDKDASLFLAKAGVTGIEFWDAASRTEGEGTRNYVVFRDDAIQINEHILYQTAEEAANERNLVLHNLTAESLSQVAELGGFPMPSLAIATEAVPFEGFGDISLIARNSILDRARAFDRDIYSPRVPAPQWTVNQKAIAPVQKRLQTMQAADGVSYDGVHDIHGRVDLYSDGVLNSPQHFRRHLSTRIAARRAYREDQGRPYTLPTQRKAAAGEETYQPLVEYLRENPTTHADIDSELGRLVLEAFDHEARVIDQHVEGYFEQQQNKRARMLEIEPLFNTTAHRMLETYLNIAQETLQADYKQVEADLLHNWNEPGFDAWVDEIVRQVFTEPRIKIGRQWRPYTVENVVEAMRKQALVGGEELGMTYGPRRAAAMAARELHTIEDIKANNARIDHIERVSGFDTLQERSDAIHDAVLPYFRLKDIMREVDDLSPDFGNTWDGLNALYEGIGQYLRKRAAGRRASLQGELSRQAYAELPADVLATVQQYADELADITVNYLEAKVDDALYLQDFAAAVVPADTPATVRGMLEAAGLAVREYTDSTQRWAQVMDTAETMGDILFATEGENRYLNREHMQAVQQALEAGEWVPDNVLAEYQSQEWARAEIERRSSLRAEAQQARDTGQTAEEWAEMQTVFDMDDHGAEYFRHIYETAGEQQSTQTVEQIAGEWVESLTREGLSAYLHAVKHNRAADQIPHNVVAAITKGLQEGQTLTEAQYKKAMDQIRWDPPHWFEVLSSLTENHEDLQLLEQAARAHPEEAKVRTLQRQVRELRDQDRRLNRDIESLRHQIELDRKYEQDLTRRIEGIQQEAAETETALTEALTSARREARMQGRLAREAQRQALIDERARVRQQIRDQIKVRDYVKRLIKETMRRPGTTIAIEFADQIAEIQAGLDPRSFRRGRAGQMRNILRERIPNITEEALQQIMERELGRQSLRDMSLAELEAIHDQIQELRDQGRYVRQQQLAMEAIALNQEREAVAAAIRRGEDPDRIIGKGSREAAAELRTGLVHGIAFESLRPERIAKMFDSGAEGVTYELLWNETNRATDATLRNSDARIEAGEAKMAELGVTQEALGREITADGQTYTADDVLSMYIGLQNEDSAAALEHGNRIAPRVMQSLIQELTPQEKQWGNWMIESFGDEQVARINEVLIRDKNVRIDQVDRYFPMLRQNVAYDTHDGTVVEDVLGRSGARSSYADKGFTKSRIRISPQHQTPIRLGATRIWAEQIVRQEHYINAGLHIKHMHRVFNDQRVQDAMLERYGQMGNQWTRKFINDFANPNIYKVYDGTTNTLRLLRQHAALSYLGFNVVTMAKQAPSLAFFLTKAGPGDMLAATAQYMQNPRNMNDFVDSRDPQMKHRAIDRAMEELKLLDNNAYERIIQRTGKIGMAGIRFIDKQVTNIGWLAVYNRALRQGNSEAEAIRQAQTAVLTTQPAAAAKDIAQMYRQHEALNWFLMFTNQLNQLWNMTVYDLPNAVRQGDAGTALSYAAALSIGALAMGFINRGFRAPAVEELPQELAKDFFNQFMSTVPLIGGNIKSGFEGWFGTGVDPFPVAAETGRALRTFMNEDALDEQKVRAMIRLIEQAMVVGGLPTVQPRRTVRALTEADIGEFFGIRVEE